MRVIKLTPDEVVELPINDLALQILQDMINAREWNEYNYLLRYTHDADFREHDPALHAVAEATAWLRSNALIARKPGDSNADSFIVTRRGHEALKIGVEGVRALARIEAGLHPLIDRQARRQFLLGEYENAIFSSMRLVEIRVRTLAGFNANVVGKQLMASAFKPGGPLADPAGIVAEVEGLQQLFQGAYAVLRNPSAHREVSFDDVAEAADAVVTASFLMRVLDGVEKRLNGTS
jgi:uncharacterized protein (TIGR02391 family)